MNSSKKRKFSSNVNQSITTVLDDDDDFKDTKKVKASESNIAQKLEQVELNHDEILKVYISKQEIVSINDIHPRNKGKDSTYGMVYNAHRIRLLNKPQIVYLVSKVKYDIKEDGCWISCGTSKQQPTFADPSATSRPRGIQLNSQHRGTFGETTWEQAQIMLAQTGRFAPTSEHEISHLCHTSSCVNPDHFVWELHPKNHAREKCRYTRNITCSCGKNFSLCDHTPRCIICTCHQ
jgi:hypothetical protein